MGTLRFQTTGRRSGVERAVVLGYLPARPPAGGEREQLWRRFVEQTPVYERYAAVHDRVIPIVSLEPTEHARTDRSVILEPTEA